MTKSVFWFGGLLDELEKRPGLSLARFVPEGVGRRWTTRLSEKWEQLKRLFCKREGWTEGRICRMKGKMIERVRYG